MFYRIYALIAMLTLVIASVNPSPAYTAQYVTAPPDAPVYRLNSEGDEWVLADANWGPLSPAADACSSGLPVDLNNVSRPKGCKYAIGAYEWCLSFPLFASDSAIIRKV